MNKSPARRPFRPLLAVSLAALLLGGALAVTGGGFGGSSLESSSIWGPSSSSPSGTGSGSYSDSEWTLGEVLFVMGLFVAFAVVSSLIDWVRARRRSPQAVRVQLLLTDGARVRAGLQNLAALHDPDCPGGLLTRLRESALLLLLRHRGNWGYGTLERRRAADIYVELIPPQLVGVGGGGGRARGDGAGHDRAGDPGDGEAGGADRMRPAPATLTRRRVSRGEDPAEWQRTRPHGRRGSRLSGSHPALRREGGSTKKSESEGADPTGPRVLLGGPPG